MALAALAVLAAHSPAQAQATAATQARPAARIEVSGQGSISRMPDQAIVMFSIVTNDDNATRATSANNTSYNALVARLRGLGLDPAAIRTTGYDLSFDQRPAQPNPQFQQRYGYVVSRSVTVTADRTDQAGAIVDAGVAAGVTNVGGVSFGLRDGRGAYRAALAAAVADAESQAQALAAAAHLRIVRTLSVSAGSYSGPPRPQPRFAQAMVVAAPVPTEIDPGSLNVSATVSVVYEVAP